MRLVGPEEIDVDVVVERSRLVVVAKVVEMVDDSDVTLSASLAVEVDSILDVADSLVLTSDERVVEYERVVDESVSTRSVVEDKVVDDADSVSLGSAVDEDKTEVTDEEEGLHTDANERWQNANSGMAGKTDLMAAVALQ
ncbi:hypothetical protein CEP53_006679 [Fusarium sp. AF-6]|nr:hypothetical protein CEP53_006679 [Fusarium sp. AF-6]